MTPLAFIDTETTGVHPDRHVWEVAIIRRDDDGQRETSFFIDADLSNADPFGVTLRWQRVMVHRILAGDDTAVTTPTEAATGALGASQGRSGVQCHPEGDRPNLIDPTIQRTRAWFAATERGEVHAFDTETEAEEWARLNSNGREVAWWSAEVEA